MLNDVVWIGQPSHIIIRKWSQCNRWECSPKSLYKAQNPSSDSAENCIQGTYTALELSQADRTHLNNNGNSSTSTFKHSLLWL